MTADDFVGAVAHGIQEQLIGAQYRAVQLEFDDRLDFRNRRQLAFEIGLPLLLFADVGRVLDHFQRATALVTDRTVGGLQPDIGAVLAHAAITAGVVGALSQFVPEFCVGRGITFFRTYEHAVMLSQDLVQG